MLGTATAHKPGLFADFNYWADAESTSAPGWPTPAAITPRLRPVPAFNETHFPPALRPALRDVAHRMQCPLDWPAVAWMVSLGSVVGNRCGIYPKQLDTGWLELANLWGAIVADPSKMKTPTLNAALVPIKRLEKAARDDYKQNAQQHEAQAEALKARKEAVKLKMKQAATKGNELDMLALVNDLAGLESAEAPAARRYIVNDTTVEMLAELLTKSSPRGLLAFRDELTGLFLSWEKPGRETDRQFYLEAWNGTGDFSTDRIGRGSLHIPNCCLSLLGGIQPDKLAHYLQQAAHGDNDGMVQRLSLLTWPDPRPFKYVDAAPNEAIQAEAAELLRRLDEFDPLQAGAVLSPGQSIPAFHFDPHAQTVFVQWLEMWQRDLDHGDDAPMLVQHLTKYRKLYPALALLFHLLDVVSGQCPPGPVSQNAAELAGHWCTYFAAHARRVYAYGTGGTGAATLGERLKAGKLTAPFTVRDVQQKSWQGLSEKAAVLRALDELTDAGWVREVAAQAAAPTGRPRATAFECNPLIFSSNT